MSRRLAYLVYALGWLGFLIFQRAWAEGWLSEPVAWVLATATGFVGTGLAVWIYRRARSVPGHPASRGE